MVIEAALIAASAIPAIILVTGFAQFARPHWYTVIGAESFLSFVFGASVATLVFGLPAYYAIGNMLIPPLLIRLVVWIQQRQTQKALDGAYGNEVQWAVELINDGDRQFTIAANSLSDMEMREIGIVAESKQDLRDRTVERFEELADDSIPEDFIQ